MVCGLMTGSQHPPASQFRAPHREHEKWVSTRTSRALVSWLRPWAASSRVSSMSPCLPVGQRQAQKPGHPSRSHGSMTHVLRRPQRPRRKRLGWWQMGSPGSGSLGGGSIAGRNSPLAIGLLPQWDCCGTGWGSRARRTPGPVTSSMPPVAWARKGRTAIGALMVGRGRPPGEYSPRHLVAPTGPLGAPCHTQVPRDTSDRRGLHGEEAGPIQGLPH